MNINQKLVLACMFILIIIVVMTSIFKVDNTLRSLPQEDIFLAQQLNKRIQAAPDGLLKKDDYESNKPIIEMWNKQHKELYEKIKTSIRIKMLKFLFIMLTSTISLGAGLVYLFRTHRNRV